jgi:hypothetical protein
VDTLSNCRSSGNGFADIGEEIRVKIIHRRPSSEALYLAGRPNPGRLQRRNKNVRLPVAGDGRRCLICLMSSFERGLHVVIQNILVRMRAQPYGIDFPGTFIPDPSLDQVLAEHSAFEQKLMVLFEVAQRFV